LKELDPLPERVFFVNSGVRLTTRGSALLGDLRELEQRGVRLLSCGTCLDYYHLQDALEIGTVTNMYDIAAALVAADRVLKP
jgi:selenium metabolism protein YedF